MLQWNHSNTDALAAKLISEVSSFQGENNMYLYKVVIWPGVLIKRGAFISEVSFKRVF